MLIVDQVVIIEIKGSSRLLIKIGDKILVILELQTIIRIIILLFLQILILPMAKIFLTNIVPATSIIIGIRIGMTNIIIILWEEIATKIFSE
jgi:hypothetical protein